MNMDRPIHFATAAKQITQRQMDFSGAPIHPRHPRKHLNGLIGLIVN